MLTLRPYQKSLPLPAILRILREQILAIVHCGIRPPGGSLWLWAAFIEGVLKLARISAF